MASRDPASTSSRSRWPPSLKPVGERLELTRDPAWALTIERCVAWFLGANDAGLAVYDPATGGGFDGLHRDRVNQNQGAESTLAALSTLQLGRLAAAQPVR